MYYCHGWPDIRLDRYWDTRKNERPHHIPVKWAAIGRIHLDCLEHSRPTLLICLLIDASVVFLLQTVLCLH